MFNSPDTISIVSVLGLIYLLLATLAIIHVLQHKSNPSSAIMWLAMILLSPVGMVVYWLFGINRIHRRARAERRERLGTEAAETAASGGGSWQRTVVGGARRRHSKAGEAGFAVIGDTGDSVLPASLLNVGQRVHDAPYLGGNNVEVLENGDEAYPAMLEAIGKARESVLLSSYIFANDEAGGEFVRALIAARQRGVLVRVLIDGVGVRYGMHFWNTADRALRRGGVEARHFLPWLSSSGTRFINLRNHRKLLICDGEEAFLGGINIRQGNRIAQSAGRHATRDLHFRVLGPVVQQVSALFEHDWLFASGEALSLPKVSHDAAGEIVARVLPDGPDRDYRKLKTMLMAAIAEARQSIRILTPYFLPDSSLYDALRLAALRGVEIQLLVPERNNLFFVGWAMQANEPLWLSAGFRIALSPPPFDHGKLFVVDDRIVFVGSSNWDTRSHELNFEITLETYSPDFAEEMVGVFNQRWQASRALDRERNPSLPYRLRNNLFRLFTPYL